MKATWVPQMLRKYNMLPNAVLKHWHAGAMVALLASHIQKMGINGIPRQFHAKHFMLIFSSPPFDLDGTLTQIQ